MPRVVLAEKSKTGLRFEIGPRQKRLWRSPNIYITCVQSSCAILPENCTHMGSTYSTKKTRKPGKKLTFRGGDHQNLKISRNQTGWLCTDCVKLCDTHYLLRPISLFCQFWHVGYVWSVTGYFDNVTRKLIILNNSLCKPVCAYSWIADQISAHE